MLAAGHSTGCTIVSFLKQVKQEKRVTVKNGRRRRKRRRGVSTHFNGANLLQGFDMPGAYAEIHASAVDDAPPCRHAQCLSPTQTRYKIESLGPNTQTATYAVFVGADGTEATSPQVRNVPHLDGAIAAPTVKMAATGHHGPDGPLVTSMENKRG